MKWYQDAQGNCSSMRIMVMVAVVTGCVVVLTAVVGWLCGVENAVAVAGVGAGLVGLCSLAKAWQKKTEEA